MKTTSRISGHRDDAALNDLFPRNMARAMASDAIIRYAGEPRRIAPQFRFQEKDW
jgi:hypothetical protein